MKSRQYKAIAGAVRDSREAGGWADANESCIANEYAQTLSEHIADALWRLDREKHPHNFSRKKFLRDCEPKQKDPKLA